jgi:predicted alpha-1,6-mannanase (GH76 family)
MTARPEPAEWAAERAAAAEDAVLSGHLRRLWGLPGTALATVSRPETRSSRWFVRWHYWWQAHLLDCLVDAQLRAPTADRRRRIAAVVRAVRVRNGRWTNRYYDDMAWLVLALQRADAVAAVSRPRAVRRLTTQLLAAWSDAEGGGIPWRRGDEFKNAPANGPAAIALARAGALERAAATADWLHARLVDPDTGLVWDGVRPGQVERTVYSYGQGVVLGADLELANRLPRVAPTATRRVVDLVAAVPEHLAVDGVLLGHPGADPGLFTGILVRYLALVAADLPGGDPAARRTRAIAAALVTRTADAIWDRRRVVDGRPLFPADPTGDDDPGPHLSTQLAGWMVLEAASRVPGAAAPAPSTAS